MSANQNCCGGSIWQQNKLSPQLQFSPKQVEFSPQPFWFTEAILRKRFVEATKSFSPCIAPLVSPWRIFVVRYFEIKDFWILFGKDLLLDFHFSIEEWFINREMEAAVLSWAYLLSFIMKYNNFQVVLFHFSEVYLFCFERAAMFGTAPIRGLFSELNKIFI